MAKKFENEMEEEYNENEELSERTKEIDNSAQNFITKNLKFILIGLGVVIAIVLAVVYFNTKSKQESEQAASMISRILAYYETGDYDKALNGDTKQTYTGEQYKGLKYIADEFSGTDQGKLASMYVGNIYLSKAKYSDAKRYFEMAQKSGNKDVQNGSKAGLAACLETENKYEEAGNLYEEAAKSIVDNDLQSRYMYYSGLCFEKSGNKEKAEKIYRDISMKSGLTEFGQLAKQGLIRIGTIIE